MEDNILQLKETISEINGKINTIQDEQKKQKGMLKSKSYQDKSDETDQPTNQVHQDNSYDKQLANKIKNTLDYIVIEMDKLRPNMQKNQEKVEAKQQELKDNQTKLEILVESHLESIQAN